MKKIQFLGVFLTLGFFPFVLFADVIQTNYFSIGSGSGRALSTVYQNTTGYPMTVAIAAYANTSASNMRCYSSSSSNPTNVEVGISIDTVGGYPYTCTFQVPLNYYYSIVIAPAGGVLYDWTEWAMASTTSGTGTTLQLVGLAATNTIALTLGTTTFSAGYAPSMQEFLFLVFIVLFIGGFFFFDRLLTVTRGYYG